MSEDFIEHNAETIYDLFFDHQALVKLERGEIVVTTFGHPYENELQLLYDNLSQKLVDKGVNPKFFWLAGYSLRFEFL